MTTNNKGVDPLIKYWTAIPIARLSSNIKTSTLNSIFSNLIKGQEFLVFGCYSQTTKQAVSIVLSPA